MATPLKSIGDLFEARDEAVNRRDEADAEIKRLDRLIAAVELLKSAGIVDLPVKEASFASLPRKRLTPAPSLAGTEAEKVRHRDMDVMNAIKNYYPNEIFTVPDLTPLVGVTKRSIKRALDDMIYREEVELVEKGFKRRPTKYRLLQQAENKDNAVETQDSPEN